MLYSVSHRGEHDLRDIKVILDLMFTVHHPPTTPLIIPASRQHKSVFARACRQMILRGTFDVAMCTETN
eukprot:SAG11_NODE_637_length_8033_cov_4.585707_9_plen_69_part_00